MISMESEENAGSPVDFDEPLETEADRTGYSPFPIVGVGASAGGLEAFRALLSELPESTGMAFVLIQHLDPRHESRLAEVLEKVSPMPIREATHGTLVEPDHVYVIPPDATMTV